MTHPVVLGTMLFGTRTDRATSYALLDRYLARGGDTIDTADCYAFWLSETGSGGQSEQLIGDWLRENPGVRENVVIATKVGVEPQVPGVFDGRVQGLSAEVIARGAAASRERLGVDVIDLYWAHGEDRSVDLAETVGAFGQLVADGAVRRLGVSNHPTWRVERAREIARREGLEPFTALQLSTSYVEARPGAAVEGKDHRFGWVNEETRDYVAEHPEIELWAYSPLIQGSYDRTDRPFPAAYDHPGTTARLAVAGEVAQQHGVAVSTVVLAWLIRHGIRPIAGVSGLEQLDAAMDAADLAASWDVEQVAALDAPA